MPRTPITVPDPPADCAFTLLADDGTQLIKWGKAISRTDRHDVLATEGTQRHTRALNDRTRRKYTIQNELLDREEQDVLRDAYLATRNGAGQIAWRHPEDDEPGTADDAPRWRMIADGWQVGRTKGGQFGVVRVELEEV